MKNKKWKVSEVGEKEHKIYNTKAKKLKRKKREWGILAITLGLAIVIILGYSNIDNETVRLNLEAQARVYQNNDINRLESNTVPNLGFENTMKNEVMALIMEAGLNMYEAYSIIQCESNWNPDAMNLANTNGSNDMGLWQINSIHKDISNIDKLDYIKSTKWAIAKRLNDENYSAWVCSRKLGL